MRLEGITNRLVACVLTGAGIFTAEEVLVQNVMAQQRKSNANTLITLEQQTYKVILPFEKPTTHAEKLFLEKNGDKKYMEAKRKLTDLKMVRAISNAIDKPSPDSYKDMIDVLIEGGNLAQYVALEDVEKFNLTRANYQGTRDPTRPLPTPIFYQKDRSDNLIRLSPDKHLQKNDPLNLETTVRYTRNVEVEDIKYNFSADRTIRIEIECNKDATKSKSVMEAEATYWIMEESVLISSKRLRNSPYELVKLEETLTKKLKGVGVTKVDISYFKEGDFVYKKGQRELMRQLDSSFEQFNLAETRFPVNTSEGVDALRRYAVKGILDKWGDQIVVKSDDNGKTCSIYLAGEDERKDTSDDVFILKKE